MKESKEKLNETCCEVRKIRSVVSLLVIAQSPWQRTQLTTATKSQMLRHYSCAVVVVVVVVCACQKDGCLRMWEAARAWTSPRHSQICAALRVPVSSQKASRTQDEAATIRAACVVVASVTRALLIGLSYVRIKPNKRTKILSMQ